VRIELPEGALVLLVGAGGSGKTTFAGARFRPTEVLSSDAFRALVADDEGDQSATPAAFQALHLVARLRLQRRRLTVVDAVNARAPDRRPLLAAAAEHDAAAIAIVLDLPEDLCVERDRERAGRTVGEAVVRTQLALVRRSLDVLPAEGFRAVYVLDSPEAVAAAKVVRVPLPVNRRWQRGRFDVIGDVRGRSDALLALLDRLGYAVERGPDGEPLAASHPDGRVAVFAGDVAAGPDGPGVLRLVNAMIAAGSALCVAGDEDPADFSAGLPSHLVLDGGALVVAHAGLRSALHGRDSARVREAAVHGEPGWEAGYRGRALVVYGHTPAAEPRWVGRTVCIDTGCGRGGPLTALRHPEREVVSVPAI
jgi:protein phosphatase